MGTAVHSSFSTFGYNHRYTITHKNISYLNSGYVICFLFGRTFFGIFLLLLSSSVSLVIGFFLFFITCYPGVGMSLDQMLTRSLDGLLNEVDRKEASSDLLRLFNILLECKNERSQKGKKKYGRSKWKLFGYLREVKESGDMPL